MQTKRRNIKAWLLVIALSYGAFVAGSQLRDKEITSVAVKDSSVQASMLLKLMPECSPVSAVKPSADAGDNKELMSDVVKLLRSHYVEPITGEREAELARGAVRGMLNSLDDIDSHFLDPTERKLLDDAGLGKFHGIGAVLSLRHEKVRDLNVTKILVVAPMPGSPAEAAGLKPGDSITHLNGKWIITYDPFQEANVEKMAKDFVNKKIDELTYKKAFEAADKKLKDGMGISDALDVLTAKTSGEANILVERKGQIKPIELKLQCKNTEIVPVSSRMLKNGVSYIRISQFSTRATKEFITHVNRVQSQSAKGIVLDLRNNPGGTMNSAAAVAGKLSGEGTLGTIQEKGRRSTVKMTSSKVVKLPIAILVNGGTSSVAELVAGTLREKGLATLVGDKTFGDGLAQTPMLLKDGSAAVLTTGKMLTIKGYDFTGKGIQPDKQVPQSRQGDAQLDKAAGLILAKLGKA